MLSEHISGDSVVAAEMRCSTVMVTAPPVVMFTMESQLCLMRGRNCMKIFGSGLGRPSLGSRACRCRMAAPACAASIACCAIWSGVIGRASDMVGVWIEPVMAQVMITLFDFWGMLVSGCARRGSERDRVVGPFYKHEAQPLPTSSLRFSATPPAHAVGKRCIRDILDCRF